MKRLAARDAKTRFGELLDAAQREPVAIEKHGRRVAVMISAQDFEDIEILKRETLQRELDRGIADLEAGRKVDGDDFIEALIQDTRD